MRYLSVASGVEAATLAWHPLGWEPVAFSEIAPFPSAVLAHHWPDVPNLGDFTRINRPGGPNVGTVDLLVGGTPCQAWSVAGKRGGLDDPRGELSLEFVDLARRVGARWVVWENVPGVLSQNGGRDFGAILGALGQRGYGFAYRVLDAQHFGVPQRRRRVFVVGYLGDWRRAAAVLFERHSLSWDPPPRRGQRAEVAGCLEARTGSRGHDPGAHGAATGHLVSMAIQEDKQNGVLVSDTAGSVRANAPGSQPGGTLALVPVAYGGNDTSGPRDVAACLTAKGGTGRMDFESETFVAHTLRAEGFDASEDGTGRGTPLVPVAFHMTHDPISGEASPALGRTSMGMGAMAGNAVRRLTPVECERLMGLCDNHTRVPYRGRLAKDGPRYKAIGNSMAVPVMRWIGERIAMVEALRGLPV